MNDNTIHARETALAAAVAVHAAINGDLTLRRGVDRTVTFAAAETEIRSTADNFAAWLLGATRLTFTRGMVLDQATGQPTGTTNQGDIVQIHDDEKFTLTVHATDAKGFETSDTIDWSVDNTDAVTLNVSEDGKSCEIVAGVPGSAVVTVADNQVDPPLSATEAVDVVAGGTALITLSEGPVSKQ